MKWFISVAIQIAANALILFGASRLIDGVTIQENLGVLFIAGALLWAGNAIVRPIVSILALPLLIVTFGLFHFVITAFLLWGIDILMPQFEIANIVALLLLTAFVSIVGAIFSFVK